MHVYMERFYACMLLIQEGFYLYGGNVCSSGFTDVAGSVL